MIIKGIKRLLILLLGSETRAILFVFSVTDTVRSIMAFMFFPAQKDIIRKFLKGDKKFSIFFSTIPFDTMVQRPQQLCRGYDTVYGEDHKIIYVCIPFLDLKPNVKLLSENILEINSFSHLLYFLENGDISQIDFVYYYYVFYNRFVERLRKKIRVETLLYDYLDDISISETKIETEHLKALEIADKVSVTADTLGLQVGKIRNDFIYIPNGVNITDWSIDDQEFLNTIKKRYNLSGNVIGFYGAIEEWIDFDIIQKIISDSSLTLVIIGIDNKKLLEKHNILGKRNVLFLGYKPYKELKYYSALFQVAIIPFKINALTNGVSPVKFFEYLLQGKPVVTTGFHEIKKHSDFCFVSDNQEQFMENIYLALEKAKAHSYIQEIKEYGEKFDWNRLVTLMK